ncbi:MAG: glycerol-3-phosphate dehydrogenase [Myxococcales bacterium]|nr:glycerol-3-phosphate dehydrogenase [Myxococcales bacterium]
MAPHRQHWAHLSEDFDVLIIGAGIMGSGIARDAARRGLRVALIDQHDIGYGTSSRSSKLVHGGLRYLEQWRFALVFESVKERRILQRIAPHLVRPLAFLFPIYKGARIKLWMLRVGMWLYDIFSLFRAAAMHRMLSPAEALIREPSLKRQGLKGAPLYYDCSTDDARLTLETALDAREAGARVVTHCEAISLRHDQDGRLTAVEVKDVETGESQNVFARLIVNATGPWTDSLLQCDGKNASMLQLTKGVHIAVAHERLPLAQAITCINPIDQRVMFAIPWGSLTYLGTTDTPFTGQKDDVAASYEDVQYVLAAAHAYFPALGLDARDVSTTWAGIRPLIRPLSKEGMSPSSISREHEIRTSDDGLITVAGGKLTTYRQVAKEVVDLLIKRLYQQGQAPNKLRRCDTAYSPLPGARGLGRDPEVLLAVLQASHGMLAEGTARHLMATYGVRAQTIARMCGERPDLLAPLIDGLPEILAQVYFAVEQELARSVTDVLVRRTQIFFRARDHGLAALDVVSCHMAPLLGWSSTDTEKQRSDYFAYVKLHQRWKTGGEHEGASQDPDIDPATL